MKQIAGQFFGDTPKGNILDDVVRRVPMLAEKKLTPVPGPAARDLDRRADQQLLRLDAQHRPDPREHRRRPPVRAAEDGARSTSSATPCWPTARRSVPTATAAARSPPGTKAELGNLTRFLTYHEHHGDRAEARRQYAELSPEARDWSGADLEAARAACPNRLDFARLLPEVERHLA